MNNFEIQKFAAITSGASTVTVEGSTITYKVEELDATAHVTLPADYATDVYTVGSAVTIGAGTDNATIYSVTLVDSETREANVTATTADGSIAAASLDGVSLTFKTGSAADVTISVSNLDTLYNTDIQDAQYYTGSQNISYQLSGSSEIKTGSATFDSLGHISISGLSAEEELGASYTIGGSNQSNQNATITSVTTKTGTFTLTNGSLSTQYSVVAGDSGSASIYVVENDEAGETPVSTDGKVTAAGQGPTYNVTYDDSTGFNVANAADSAATLAVTDASVKAHYADFTSLNAKVLLADDNSIASVVALDTSNTLTPSLDGTNIKVGEATYALNLGSATGEAAATLVATSEPPLASVESSKVDGTSYEATVTGATNDFALVFDSAGSLTAAYFATDTVRSTAVNSGDTIKDGSNIYTAAYTVEGKQASLSPAGDSVKYAVTPVSTETAVTISADAPAATSLAGAVVEIVDGSLSAVTTGESTYGVNEGAVTIGDVVYTLDGTSLKGDKNAALDTAVATQYFDSLAADTAHVTLSAALGGNDYTIRLSSDGSVIESIYGADGTAVGQETFDSLTAAYTIDYVAADSSATLQPAGAGQTLDAVTGEYSQKVDSIAAGVSTVIGEYTAIVSTDTNTFVGLYTEADSATNLVTAEGGSADVTINGTEYSVVTDTVDGAEQVDLWNNVTDTISSVAIKDSTTAKVDASSLTVANAWADAETATGTVDLSFTIGDVTYTAEAVPYSADGKFMQRNLVNGVSVIEGVEPAELSGGAGNSATSITSAALGTDGLSYNLVIGGKNYVISANQASLQAAATGADAGISLTGAYSLNLSDTLIGATATVLGEQSDSIATSSQAGYTEIEYVYDNKVKYVVYAENSATEDAFNGILTAADAYNDGKGFSGVDSDLRTSTAQVAVYTLKGSSWALASETGVVGALSASISGNTNIVITDNNSGAASLPGTGLLAITLSGGFNSSTHAVSSVTATPSEIASAALSDSASVVALSARYDIVERWQQRHRQQVQRWYQYTSAVPYRHLTIYERPPASLVSAVFFVHTNFSHNANTVYNARIVMRLDIAYHTCRSQLCNR